MYTSFLSSTALCPSSLRLISIMHIEVLHGSSMSCYHTKWCTCITRSMKGKETTPFNGLGNFSLRGYHFVANAICSYLIATQHLRCGRIWTTAFQVRPHHAASPGSSDLRSIIWGRHVQKDHCLGYCQIQVDHPYLIIHGSLNSPVWHLNMQTMYLGSRIASLVQGSRSRFDSDKEPGHLA